MLRLLWGMMPPGCAWSNPTSGSAALPRAVGIRAVFVAIRDMAIRSGDDGEILMQADSSLPCDDDTSGSVGHAVAVVSTPTAFGGVGFGLR